MSDPFAQAQFGGIAPNLIPTPPAAMPELPDVPDPMANMSPFTTAQDVDSIIAQLSIDRPLPLYIPNRERYKGWQFHIVNSTQREIADAMRRGFRVVDDPELLRLFEGKVSGTDDKGVITKPVLMARENRIGDVERQLKQKKLREQYKGLDPRNKQFNSQHAETQSVINAGVTAGKFGGAFWNIRVG